MKYFRNGNNANSKTIIKNKIKMHRSTFSLILFLSSFALLVNAQPFVVKTDQVKAEIQPTMYGVFFEDINFAADGGIYAEMVKNRSFELYNHMMGWK